MELWHIILLALIQGITEFLPISSSAHLILLPHLTGLQDQGQAFDVALHVGTLSAVLWYFRADLKPLWAAWRASVVSGQHTPHSRLVWGVGVATIPAVALGLVLAVSDVDELLRDQLVIASTTILFGLLLWWADWLSKRERDEYSLSWQDISLIGLAQALALIPGTSRSGITITAGLLLGLSRKAAARYSFLLSIPIILVAGAYETLVLMRDPNPVDWNALWLGMILSAVSAYFCIQLFIGVLDRIGMLPFVLYRLALGVVLLIWVV